MKKYFSMIMVMVALLPMLGCSKTDEPTQNDRLASIEVTYTYTVSEEMLTYFNITANYANANGEVVGKQMNSPELVITTSANKFPANRPISFTVTRTDVPSPEVVPSWSTNLKIVVTKRYSPSGQTEESYRNNSMTYSPRPDKFGEWAKQFIQDMARVQNVSVTASGEIDF